MSPDVREQGEHLLHRSHTRLSGIRRFATVRPLLGVGDVRQIVKKVFSPPSKLNSGGREEARPNLPSEAVSPDALGQVS